MQISSIFLGKAHFVYLFLLGLRPAALSSLALGLCNPDQNELRRCQSDGIFHPNTLAFQLKAAKARLDGEIVYSTAPPAGSPRLKDFVVKRINIHLLAHIQTQGLQPGLLRANDIVGVVVNE